MRSSRFTPCIRLGFESFSSNSSLHLQNICKEFSKACDAIMFNEEVMCRLLDKSWHRLYRSYRNMAASGISSKEEMLQLVNGVRIIIDAIDMNEISVADVEAATILKSNTDLVDEAANILEDMLPKKPWQYI